MYFPEQSKWTEERRGGVKEGLLQCAPQTTMHLPRSLELAPESQKLHRNCSPASNLLLSAQFLFWIPEGGAAAPHSVSLSGLKPQLKMNLDLETQGQLRKCMAAADWLSQLSKKP